jgi:hypothetical protein
MIGLRFTMTDGGRDQPAFTDDGLRSGTDLMDGSGNVVAGYS